MFKSFSMDLAGRRLTVEIGRVAAQANGAAFMHYGGHRGFVHGHRIRKAQGRH